MSDDDDEEDGDNADNEGEEEEDGENAGNEGEEGGDEDVPMEEEPTADNGGDGDEDEEMPDAPSEPVEPPSFDGVGEVLPSFCRSLINLEKLWLGTHNWEDLWESGTPECRQSVEILLAAPKLKSLRGCVGIPVHIWCYNPSLTHIDMDTCGMPEEGEEPFATTSPYAPLKIVETKNQFSWLGELLDLHPGLFSKVENLKVYTHPEEAVTIQRLLDATADTITDVAIDLDNAWVEGMFRLCSPLKRFHLLSHRNTNRTQFCSPEEPSQHRTLLLHFHRMGGSKARP